MNDIHNYDDIINKPRHVSLNHPPMSRSDRAAQFAPFAALTGHKEAVKEMARVTDIKKILDNDQLEIINFELQKIKKLVNDFPLVKVTYFIKDQRKKGGKYVEVTNNLKKIDEYNSILFFDNGLKININDIYQIQMIENNY